MPEKFANVLVTRVYLADHRSLRQPDAPQQVGVARVGTEIAERRVKFDVINTIASSRPLLQSRERGILLAEHGVITGRVEVVPFGFVILGIFPQVPLVPRPLKNLSQFLGTRFVAL